MDKYSIDAAIIAKDEVANLNDLIQNLSAFCRSIILVDTGSMDNTPTFASSLGAEVYFHQWTNNFAHSRNYAIKYTTAEWILSIDADERVDINSLRNCLSLMNNPEVGGIRLNIINYTNTEQTQYTEHRYTRLFRRDPRIKFEGAIHEQVSESIIGAGFKIEDADTNIFHYGYINPGEKKKQRNITMLEEEHKHSPESAWYKFHLASAEFANNNLPRAKELFTQAISGSELAVEQHEMSIVRLAQIALKAGEHQEIDKLSFNSIGNASLSGLLKSIYATSLLERKCFAEAYKIYSDEEVLNSAMVDRDSIQSMLAALKDVL